MSNLGDALAWRSVFEIVKSIEMPVGVRRRARAPLPTAIYGLRRRVRVPDERALPDEPGNRCLRMLCGDFYGAESTGLAP
jgi:hypothetical protein